MTMLLTIALSSMGMSYEQARERALFLTDKMAYELNLNDEQYEAAYEVNLDYLMSINTYDDLYGTYWTRRNTDLGYILFDWQYSAFRAAAYFFRPLVWTNGVWRFSIYSRYPNRTYFYFGRPAFYATYCGGHSWHKNGGRSWYNGRKFGPRPGESRFGMRDRYDRGDYRGPKDKGHRPDNGRYDRRNDRNDRKDNGRYDRNDRNDRRNDNGRYDRKDDRKDNGRYDRNDRNDRRNDNGGYRGTTSRRSSNGPTNLSSSRTTVNREVTRSSRDIGGPSSVRTSARRDGSSVSRSAGGSSRPASTFSPSRGNGSGSSRASGGHSGGGRTGGGGRLGGGR